MWPPLESIPFRRRLEGGREKGFLSTTLLRTKGAERPNITAAVAEEEKGASFRMEFQWRRLGALHFYGAAGSVLAAAGKAVTVKGAVSGLPRSPPLPSLENMLIFHVAWPCLLVCFVPRRLQKNWILGIFVSTSLHVILTNVQGGASARGPGLG